MDIPTPNTSHEDDTETDLSREDVIGTPSLGLSKSSAGVSVAPGTPSTSLTFRVKNSGSGVLGFQATSNKTWLKATPAAGVALGSDLGSVDSTIGLTLNTAGMAAGVYTGKITISSLYAQDAPKTFTVNLTVGDPPPTPAPGGIWGDNDCSQSIPDPIDSLLTLRHDAGLAVDTGACPHMGVQVPIGAQQRTWGDIDCSGGVDPIDALKILIYDSGQSVTQAAGCPALGSEVAFP